MIAVVLAPGCGSRDEIQSYTVPKEVQSPTDRMMAAILPAGDQAWFFKVVGPLTEVEKRAEEVNKFFGSVRLAENGRPTWELPAADWTQEEGSGMRAATIRIPSDGEPLELSVIGLPWRGTPGEQLSNINRWRGQMKLPDVRQEQLAEFTRELKAGEATMTVVDLRGEFDAGPAMTPPFAGAVGDASRAGPDSARDLPAGHPPIDGTAAANVAGDAPKFEVPETWQPLPAGGMRKAAFQIGGEARGATVTVIDFPADAGPMIADPLQNINRWRREVGMAEIDQPQLKETVEAIQVDGHPASYVKLVPDATKVEESQADRATLAALVNSGDRIWFFKMNGNREIVAAQEDEFKSFLKSVRFATDNGARDGNK
jgi:hypothetical protein